MAAIGMENFPLEREHTANAHTIRSVHCAPCQCALLMMSPECQVDLGSRLVLIGNVKLSFLFSDNFRKQLRSHYASEGRQKGGEGEGEENAVVSASLCAVCGQCSLTLGTRLVPLRDFLFRQLVHSGNYLFLSPLFSLLLHFIVGHRPELTIEQCKVPCKKRMTFALQVIADCLAGSTQTDTGKRVALVKVTPLQVTNGGLFNYLLTRQDTLVPLA